MTPGRRGGDGRSVEDLLRPWVGSLFRGYDGAKVKLLRPAVLVHGSYFTSNVGDRVIGLVIRGALRRVGVRTLLVSRFFARIPSDAVLVVGGGGVIHDDYRGNLRRRTRPAAHAGSALYFCVGCPGLENVDEEGFELLSRLERADYLSVRDRESAEILGRHLAREMKVQADPAWMFERFLDADRGVRSTAVRTVYNLRFLRPLRPWAAAASSGSTPRIGLALREAFDHANIPWLRRSVSRLAARARLYFIPFAGVDVGFYRRHLADLDVACFPVSDPVTTYHRIRRMDRVVAMRYHSLIFAALARKPVVALAYARKVATLGRDLKVPTIDVREEADVEPLDAFVRADREAVAALERAASDALDELVEVVLRVRDEGSLS